MNIRKWLLRLIDRRTGFDALNASQEQSKKNTQPWLSGPIAQETKCPYCSGSGLVLKRSSIEANFPGRSGPYDGWSTQNINPYSTCAACSGTGMKQSGNP